MKKFKILAVMLILTFTVFALSACDEQGQTYTATENDCFVFEQIDGGFSISCKTDAVLPEKLVIPKTYDGQNVIKIADGAFDMTDIKYVVIPETVKNIGKVAFSGCADLRTVTVLGGVENIDNFAFYGCEKLSRCDFNTELISIGVSSFEKCNLSSINLADNIKTVGDKAFKDCKNLAFVSIGLSVQDIGYDAFSGSRSDVIFKVSPQNEHFKIVDGNLVQVD